MISPTEAKILGLLISRPKGSYGSELVHASNGTLKRGTVYTTLSRLEDAGLVRSVEEPATEEYALPRTVYKITGDGVRARNELAEFMGFSAPGLAGGTA